MTNSTKALIGILLAGTAGIIIFLFVHLSGESGSPGLKLGERKASAACTKGRDCLPEVNYIDREVFTRLKKLNMAPSDLSSDEEFLRRL